MVHEVKTACCSLGDAVTGNPEQARHRWKEYAEESFFGSGIYAAQQASCGNMLRANELGKGMGRASGKILCGGGLLRDAPVFHELATCGESLGDMIGGGDNKSARKRWVQYADHSVVGSSVLAAIEDTKGNTTRAAELRHSSGRAGAKAGITLAATAAVVGVTLATGGAGAPVAIAAGCSAGAATGAAATAGVQAIDGKIIPGDVVGNALLGGAAGAVAGGLAARGAAAGAIRAAEVETAVTVARVSAVSTAPGAGYSHTELLEGVRHRILSRRASMTREEALPEEDVVHNATSSDEVQNTTSTGEASQTHQDEEPLECSICLEVETEFPGIRRVHDCAVRCNGQACCTHAFHPECLMEWRAACEAKDVEFSCPECRRNLSDVEWLEESNDDFMLVAEEACGGPADGEMAEAMV